MNFASLFLPKPNDDKNSRTDQTLLHGMDGTTIGEDILCSHAAKRVRVGWGGSQNNTFRRPHFTTLIEPVALLTVVIVVVKRKIEPLGPLVECSVKLITLRRRETGGLFGMMEPSRSSVSYRPLPPSPICVTQVGLGCFSKDGDLP